MTDVSQPSDGLRRIMTATARLLAGEGRSPEDVAFNADLMLIVGGALDLSGSLWLASAARMNERSVAHVTFLPESGDVPIVTFAHYRRGGEVTVYEGCMLWAANAREPVRIIRIDRNVAFQMTRKNRLRCRPAPVATVEASIPGCRRAVERLFDVAERLGEEHLCMPLACPTSERA